MLYLSNSQIPVYQPALWEEKSFSQRAFLILQILAICKPNTPIYIPRYLSRLQWWFSAVWRNVAKRQKGSLVKGAVTAGDWGIKKQNTIYLKLIYPYKIPPACLRQPASLFKEGRIPPSCLTATHLPLQGRQNPFELPWRRYAFICKRGERCTEGEIQPLFFIIRVFFELQAEAF